MKKSKGFTLIELLAVIIILGIVVALASVGVSKSIKKSKEKLKVQAAEEIIAVAKAYMATNNVSSVSVKKLYEEGYLSGDVTNPETGKNISNSIELENMYVYDNNSDYKFTNIKKTDEGNLNPKDVCEKCESVPSVVCDTDGSCTKGNDIVDEKNNILISNVSKEKDSVSKIKNGDPLYSLLNQKKELVEEKNLNFLTSDVNNNLNYYSISFEVSTTREKKEITYDNCIIGILSNNDRSDTEAYFYNDGVLKNKSNVKNTFKYKKSDNGFIVTIYDVKNLKNIYLRKNMSDDSSSDNDGICTATLIEAYK